MWCCKDIDISWGTWLRALASGTGFAPRRQSLIVPDGVGAGALLTLTARSALDLFLRVRSWKPGSEIVLSALTVPDMAEIIEEHGLVPVSIDVDPVTGCWSHGDLLSSITPRTRALLLAHLFGHRYELAGALRLARDHDLDVIEDCAQAWRGAGWLGNAKATASLFSFGPTKNCTALGGGVLRVRRRDDLEQARRILESDPIQSGRNYTRRVLSYGFIKALSGPRTYALAVGLLRVLGRDHEAFVHSATRSVAGTSLMTRIRQRPCRALRHMLLDAMQRQVDWQARISSGRLLISALADHVQVPGRHNTNNHFWVVPVIADRIPEFKAELRRNGFDAMSGRLKTVKGSTGQLRGSAMLEHAVYLPFHPSMSESVLRRLGALVSAALLNGPDAAGASRQAPRT